MRGYTAIFSARFRTLLQYRAAALAGFGTQLFWGLLRLMIFDAFYRSSPQTQPMSHQEITTYIWLGQAMLLLLPWGIDGDVRGMVRSGTVAYELLRPLDLYTLWFLRTMAARTAPTLLRCIPMFIVAGLFFGLRPPPSFACGLAWVASTFGALLLGCAFSTLISTTLLLTVSGEGIYRLAGPLVYTLSGMIVPLPLMPDWMQPVLNFLPFRGLLDTPFRLYLGHIASSQTIFVLLHQFAWTIVFVIAGRLLLSNSLKRLVIQGG